MRIEKRVRRRGKPVIRFECRAPNGRKLVGRFFNADPAPDCETAVAALLATKLAHTPWLFWTVAQTSEQMPAFIRRAVATNSSAVVLVPASRIRTEEEMIGNAQ